jgi:hypothetical protein
MRRRAVALATLLAPVGVVAGTALAEGAGQPTATRVTIFGDSAATAMAYDPQARRILGRGIELKLEVAACRRVATLSCPYDGVRPPNVIERAAALGRELGPVVVVLVGYNDYENTYRENIEEALAVFRTAGVKQVLWGTLREGRASWARMNGDIGQVAKSHPEMRVVDWNAHALANPAWLQPDAIHLTPEGARGMASLVHTSLVELGVAPRPAATLSRTLAIAGGSLPAGRVGRSYARRIRAHGGVAPYRWTRLRGTLAPGLRLRRDGLVEGVPTRVGRFRFDVRVVDRTGTARTRTIVHRIAR